MTLLLQIGQGWLQAIYSKSILGTVVFSPRALCSGCADVQIVIRVRRFADNITERQDTQQSERVDCCFLALICEKEVCNS